MTAADWQDPATGGLRHVSTDDERPQGFVINRAARCVELVPPL